MPSFIIEHQCPQCGAPAELEEADRLFQCGFCRVRSFLNVPDVFRYTLPHRTHGKQLIYFPYWRFKGMLFSCVPGATRNRFVDVSQQAIRSVHFPFSMGFRTQTQKLRFASAAGDAIFLTPHVTKADLLHQLNDQFSAGLPKPLLHQAFIGETISLLYAPYYLEGKLMDGILNAPVANAVASDIEPLLDRRQEPDFPIHFLSTLCPQCGWDLAGEKTALALGCPHCRSVLQPNGNAFGRIETTHVPDPGPETVYLPFWRIQADISGIELNTYADLIRIANLPKVPQQGCHELPFRFWSPAFKVRPQSFLNFAAHLTVSQPRGAQQEGLPTGSSHSVTLPLQEAIESLALVLAFFARPRLRIEKLLPEIHIKPRGSQLVYLPFREGHHELIHPAMNLAISKNLLSHTGNL
jgi:DNA-directed RNA polymerase subunit RPC12/RpoP